MLQPDSLRSLDLAIVAAGLTLGLAGPGCGSGSSPSSSSSSGQTGGKPPATDWELKPGFHVGELEAGKDDNNPIIMGLMADPHPAGGSLVKDKDVWLVDMGTGTVYRGTAADPASITGKTYYPGKGVGTFTVAIERKDSEGALHGSYTEQDGAARQSKFPITLASMATLPLIPAHGSADQVFTARQGKSTWNDPLTLKVTSAGTFTGGTKAHPKLLEGSFTPRDMGNGLVDVKLRLHGDGGGAEAFVGLGAFLQVGNHHDTHPMFAFAVANSAKACYVWAANEK